MAHSQATWQEALKHLLETHDALSPTVDTLSWKNPHYSAFLFLSGVSIYVLNEIAGIGLMMVVGIIAIGQVLLYRFLRTLKDNNIAFSNVDLKKSFVVTPKPETVSVGVKVVGDFLRLTEERIKDLALNKNYVELVQTLMFLIFLSAVGRLVTLPNLFIGLWVFAFSVLPIYGLNEEFFDGVIDSLQQVMQVVPLENKKA